MNSFKKKSFWLQTALLAVSFFVLTGMGKCGGGGEKSKIANCVDAPANKCAEYKQTSDGARCELDTAINKCRAKAGKAPAGACAKNNENDCKDSIKCTWNTSASPAVCVDAPSVILDTCLAFERKEGCDGKLDGKGQTCEWDAAATPAHCKVNTRGAKSKYYSYEFGTMAFWYPHDVAGVASSKDRSHFYVLDNEGSSVSDDNLATWGVIENLATTGQPGDNKNPVDFTRIGLYEPLQDGLVIQNEAEDGYGIIRKKSVVAGWKNNVGNLAGKAAAVKAFQEIKKQDGTLWIYASAFGERDKGVAFQNANDIPNNLSVLWDKVIRAGGNLDLKLLYTALGQARNGGMYLGSTNGIYELTNANVGEKNGIIDTVDSNPLYKPEEFFIEAGTPNDSGPTQLALIDNTYLLIGSEGNANKGGIGSMNVDTNVWTPLPATAAMTIEKIIPSADNKSAMIQVEDEGLIIFKNGAFVEVIPGKPVITVALANDPDNASSFDKSAPKTGFKGGLGGAPVRGAMEGPDGKWYFGTSAGIVTLVVKEQDL